MIPKQNRLKDSETIRAIRTNGKSYASSLAIVIVRDSELDKTRAAFLASRSVGGAVQRNRCKRLLRPIAAKRLLTMVKAYDLLFIARKPILSATAEEIDQTMALLFEKAKLI